VSEYKFNCKSLKEHGSSKRMYSAEVPGFL